MIKLGFDTNSVNGWPPFEVEHLWLQATEAKRYIVMNTPFYLKDICYGDELELEYDKDNYVTEFQTISKSINSTVWVMELKKNAFHRRIKKIQSMNCLVEGGVPDGYYAITIPNRTLLEKFDSIIKNDVNRNYISVAYTTVRSVE